MSAGGNNYNFGDIVNMHGGSGNYGIVKGQTTPGTTPSEPPPSKRPYGNSSCWSMSCATRSLPQRPDDRRLRVGHRR